MTSELSATTSAAAVATAAGQLARISRDKSRFLLLNPDVFIFLLTLLDPLDALRVAMTSHRAYPLAIKRFHSDVRLGFSDNPSRSGPEQIIQFCNYMLADPERATHLKSLSIGSGGFTRIVQERSRDTWEFDPSCAVELAQLLRKADRLKQVLIYDYESVVQAQPILGEAMEELPNLHDLSFKHVGHASLKTVSCLNSKLRKLEFGLWKGGPLTSTDAKPFVNLNETLETLTLRSCSCLMENVGRDYVWPRVRSLILGGRVPRLSTLVHAFPDARCIEFAEGCSVARDEEPVSYWDLLDSLETSLPLPFFACPVRRVKLSYVLGSGNARTVHECIEKTLAFLERTNPVVFSCKVTQALSATRMTSLATAMPELRFLELALHQEDLCSDEVALEFERWIVSVSICDPQG